MVIFISARFPLLSLCFSNLSLMIKKSSGLKWLGCLFRKTSAYHSAIRPHSFGEAMTLTPCAPLI
eukprot:3721137-Amphidinium_carterae.1